MLNPVLGDTRVDDKPAIGTAAYNWLSVWPSEQTCTGHTFSGIDPSARGIAFIDADLILLWGIFVAAIALQAVHKAQNIVPTLRTNPLAVTIRLKCPRTMAFERSGNIVASYCGHCIDSDGTGWCGDEQYGR